MQEQQTDLTGYAQANQLLDEVIPYMNDYGFWIRRMLDGSDESLWNATVKILKTYDNEWYESTFMNREYMGMSSVSKELYDSLNQLTLTDTTILGIDAISDEWAIENSEGVEVFVKNGENKKYENNDSEGESYAEYHLKGYWPVKNSVLVSYFGWEWGDLYVINLDDGEVDSYSSKIVTNKEGTLLAEQQETMEFSAIRFLKWANGAWVETFTSEARYFGDGFWYDGSFYFQENNQYWKYGTVKL